METESRDRLIKLLHEKLAPAPGHWSTAAPRVDKRNAALDRESAAEIVDALIELIKEKVSAFPG